MSAAATNAVVLHDPVSQGAPPDAQDTLVQVAEVAAALRALGYAVATLAFTPDLGRLQEDFSRHQPAFAFNLVESVGGEGRLIHLAPALLELAGIRYTGCGAEALFATTHKVLAKKLLRHEGLPTPSWLTHDESAQFVTGSPYIVKPESEDASIGIDVDAVVFGASRDELQAILRGRRQEAGKEYFAEQYIAGREFNVSLLANGAQPDCLPPIELLFAASGAPAILHYRAKWKEHFPEHATVAKRLDFGNADDALLARMKQLAVACWHDFRLSGYARVDFRVDALGNPWVIEINGNPGLSADSNFEVAAMHGGLDLAGVVERIVAAIPAG